MQRADGQSPDADAGRWLEISGGEGIAIGAGYASAGPRNATVSLGFRMHGYRGEATALGAWTARDVFCNVADGFTCGGPPTLVGGGFSLLRGLGSARAPAAPAISAGLGAYRLSGLTDHGFRAGVFPALQAGFVAPFTIQDGFAVTVAIHAILLPIVRGRQFVYVPLSLGIRTW